MTIRAILNGYIFEFFITIDLLYHLFKAMQSSVGFFVVVLYCLGILFRLHD